MEIKPRLFNRMVKYLGRLQTPAFKIYNYIYISFELLFPWQHSLLIYTDSTYVLRIALKRYEISSEQIVQFD